MWLEMYDWMGEKKHGQARYVRRARHPAHDHPRARPPPPPRTRIHPEIARSVLLPLSNRRPQFRSAPSTGPSSIGVSSTTSCSASKPGRRPTCTTPTVPRPILEAALLRPFPPARASASASTVRSTRRRSDRPTCAVDVPYRRPCVRDRAIESIEADMNRVAQRQRRERHDAARHGVRRRRTELS